MIKYSILLIFVLLVSSAICNGQTKNAEVYSPDGKLTVKLTLIDGAPFYSANFNGIDVLDASALGFAFKDQSELCKGLRIDSISQSGFDETWYPFWGQWSQIRNNYNQIKVKLTEIEGIKRTMNLYFRAYDYGFAFRYEIPKQPGIDSIFIIEEKTSFNFSDDAWAWYFKNIFPPDYYEQLNQQSNISSIDTVIHTPITLKTSQGIYISLHEAALVNYSSMMLKPTKSRELKCSLAPWPDGILVKAKTPMITPWRSVIITQDIRKIIVSPLTLNLNEPNKLKDISYIKPMKYVGIWWGMHMNKWTWNAGPKHGATTENTKKYIDFAAKHHIGGVLVEGWNIGWENWGKDGSFDFVTPYPDYDIKALANYAQSKNIELIMHHETGGEVWRYEQQLDTAFSLMASLNLHSLKSGYVSSLKPKGLIHQGQYMVNHHANVVNLAALHKIVVDAHEPIKGTGLERTYPNFMTREGVRGMEYNAWSDGNPPEHTTILPFTRGMAGPMDYTPGIFNLQFEGKKGKHKVQSTLVNQLALYVVIYSPLQMAADLIENYEKHLDAFKFIEDVPTNWDDTKILDAKISDYIVTARRSGKSWFLGGITDENGRDVKINFDFLDKNVKYTATIYSDGKDADYEKNPTSYKIETKTIDSNSIVEFKLARGGGVAISIVPIGDN